MDDLNILGYGGITVLIILLAIFEFEDWGFGKTALYSRGYEFYTADSSLVRIHKAFGSLYKIYVYGDCPVLTKQDRYGNYFEVRARCTAEAESIVDDIYQVRR
jgi:hypothetical protein